MQEATERLAELLRAPVASLAMEPYIEQTLRLSMEPGHPVYDCIYLALALHHQTHVVTADRRFVAAANIPSLAGGVRLLSA